MIWKTFLLAIVGGSYGLLAAAGVFTVLITVGLVPRIAGETHTGKMVLLYEEMVILGTVFGGFVSIFPELCRIGAWLGRYPQAGNVLFRWTGEALLAMIGVCVGMFVGSLALAIAEMLDGIPIFTRRISFRHGIGIVVLAISLGKLCGSLFFFGTELHRAVAPSW